MLCLVACSSWSTERNWDLLSQLWDQKKCLLDKVLRDVVSVNPKCPSITGTL